MGERSIYDLGLNDTIRCGLYVVTRVPGGWIYTEYDEGLSVASTSVFVPYSNEFEPTHVKLMEKEKQAYQEQIKDDIKIWDKLKLDIGQIDKNKKE